MHFHLPTEYTAGDDSTRYLQRNCSLLVSVDQGKADSYSFHPTKQVGLLWDAQNIQYQHTTEPKFTRQKPSVKVMRAASTRTLYSLQPPIGGSIFHLPSLNFTVLDNDKSSMLEVKLTAPTRVGGETAQYDVYIDTACNDGSVNKIDTVFCSVAMTSLNLAA